MRSSTGGCRYPGFMAKYASILVIPDQRLPVRSAQPGPSSMRHAKAPTGKSALPCSPKGRAGAQRKRLSGLLRRLGGSRLRGRRLGSGSLYGRRLRGRSRFFSGSSLLLGGSGRFGARLRRYGRLSARSGFGRSAATTAGSASRSRGGTCRTRRLRRSRGCRAGGRRTRWRRTRRAGFRRLGRMDASAQALFFSLPGAPDLFGSNAQEKLLQTGRQSSGRYRLLVGSGRPLLYQTHSSLVKPKTRS